MFVFYSIKSARVMFFISIMLLNQTMSLRLSFNLNFYLVAASFRKYQKVMNGMFGWHILQTIPSHPHKSSEISFDSINLEAIAMFTRGNSSVKLYVLRNLEIKNNDLDTKNNEGSHFGTKTTSIQNFNYELIAYAWHMSSSEAPCCLQFSR